ILVNNAAVFVMRGIDASDDEWRRSLDVNVLGAARVARAVVPVMQAAGRGAIVNLGSISSFLAQP
ncbi:MAG TPA: short-chain dehydrogenase, partial [Planctomycetaceae bacterium]|nr:short-chain dehydrogenase [Planctomycetaceae bacterium]